MVRREVTELPDLPAEIAAAARSAANAQRAMAAALAPTTSQEDFEIFCAEIVARHDAEHDTIAELVDSTAALAARAKQRAKATTNLLERALFVALNEPPRNQSGSSNWHPSFSLVRGGK